MAAVYDNSAYAINGRFHLIDLTLIACVALLIRERVYTAFIFGIASALIHDALMMPSQGYSVVSLFAALLTAFTLSSSLFRENYSSRVVILAASELIKEITRAVLVFVYYNSMKKPVFPPVVLLKILFTVAAGAVIFKILEIDYKRLVSWLNPRMMFRKR
jgi:hypothetical protein